jgi:DNA polymerase-4
VVTSASHEVRPLGVRSGMPTAQAARLAPDVVFLPTRHGMYSPYSARVREILDRFSPAVRPASIDEFFGDLAGCEALHAIRLSVSLNFSRRRLTRQVRSS